MSKSIMCPVCGTWFYPETYRQKYDKPQCAKIGQSIKAARKRQQAKKKPEK